MGDKINYSDNEYSPLEGADALVIVTEWNEFRNPDFDRIRTSLKQPFIFAGRNVFSLEKMAEQGFYYESIGRSTIHESKKAELSVLS